MKAFWYSVWASGSLRHHILRRGMRDVFLLSWGRYVSMETTDQQVVLLGDLLARDNLDIPHILLESFTKEHKVNLSPSFTWGAGDQVIGSLLKTGVDWYIPLRKGQLSGKGFSVMMRPCHRPSSPPPSPNGCAHATNLSLSAWIKYNAIYYVRSKGHNEELKCRFYLIKMHYYELIERMACV